LPALLQQLVADLADPTVTYLLGGHYYERTNHPRTRHFPAVFVLRQGEVWNVGVGVDSVAFDTEFIRYPERGEPHYPGPWADRFRATVPFTQLYQLCRKVLTPAELTAPDFAYGPEHVRYYNHAVRQQYPLLADIQPAYAAVPFSDEHPLGAVLTAVAAGLVDPHNHYLVTTTSFESPDGPVGMGVLHLHAHTIWDMEIDATGFTCSVLLNARDRRHKAPVRVEFANVWQVLRSDSPHMDLATVEAAGGLLYEAPQVLSTYARQGRPV
jgi:hypothetical protein